MNRIIINIDNGIDPECAARMVAAVIGQGRISKHGKQFCYVTTFHNECVVYAGKTRNGSDVFRVAKMMETNKQQTKGTE